MCKITKKHIETSNKFPLAFASKPLAFLKEQCYNFGIKWEMVQKFGIFSESGVNRLQISADTSRLMSGELPYTIDSKGRMSFPQRFREVIGDRFILTRGADRRLVAYSEEKWNELMLRISSMREGREKEILKQIYIKGAIAVEADKMGRILVPQALREYAMLMKDVYVVGAVDTAEIWDKATYETFTQSIAPEELYLALGALED